MTIEMFEEPGQKRGRPEDREFYAAVRYLRRQGYRVMRISNVQHKVDHRLLSGRQLLDMATRLGWKEK